jgi:hypothetical protein
MTKPETTQERRDQRRDRRSSHDRRSWGPPPEFPFYDSEGEWVTKDRRKPGRDRRQVDRRNISGDSAIHKVFNRFVIFGAVGALIVFLWIFRNSEAFSVTASGFGRFLNVIKRMLGG